MNTTPIHKLNRPRVSLVFTPVRHCEICGGKSNLFVNGHHACGRCLKAGRVLRMLEREKAAREFSMHGTVVFCNGDLPDACMEELTARTLKR